MSGRPVAAAPRHTLDEVPLRVLFVNSGILGHRSVARLVRDAVAADPSIDATHLDLSEHMDTRDRLIRRVLCASPGIPRNLDLARWRQEYHVGLLAARRMGKLERDAAFDVIHFHPQPTAWGSVRRMRRTPAVVSIDITQRLAAAAVSGIERRTRTLNAATDRRVFRAAAQVTVTSQWAADDLLRGQPSLRDRVHVLPYPVPLDGFDASWAAQRGAGGAGTRFLFIGGDFVRKGGAELLQAWSASGLARTSTLTLVTDAPLAAIPEGVRQVKRVQAYSADWFALWRNSDVFVMPTRDEAFGMVFQEAAAAGLPAIGTHINAIPEIVVHGETGILIPPGDVAALIAAMQQLNGDAGLRQRLGTAARARMETVASMAAYAARLSHILHRAADRA